MPKIAISGKGGVGKTTLAALLAHIAAKNDRKVLAIDADPAANLATALAFPPEVAARIVPIAEMGDLITERTGAQPGTYGTFFKINPTVDDIPDRFSATHRGVRLLVLGAVKRGGSGCICPESVLLKSLVTHLLLERRELVILDMEAGTEHLGRATAQAVDAMVIVVEPGRRSLQIAQTIVSLARDIGIPKLYLVGNKVRDEADRQFIVEKASTDTPVLGFLSFSSKALDADREGMPIFDVDPRLVAEATNIAQRLNLIEA
jgi:CO dehydrogenase maturation factor